MLQISNNRLTIFQNYVNIMCGETEVVLWDQVVIVEKVVQVHPVIGEKVVRVDIAEKVVQQVHQVVTAERADQVGIVEKVV